MICPNCNVEYRDGFTECSDCKVNLIRKKDQKKVRIKYSSEGIALIKYGIGLLFLSIFEIIAAIITYEFYWVYRMNNGGVQGSAVSNVHTSIWILIGVEIFISLIVIICGANIAAKEDS